MSTKTIRARKMWHDPAFNFINERDVSGVAKPVLLLPRDAESYDRMVEQVALALAQLPKWRHAPDYIQESFRKSARAVLAALGIKRPTGGKQK
jgi:hypothetical protein